MRGSRRSSSPPQDFRVSVDELDRVFIELLFVRSAWDLPVEIRALEPAPDIGDSTRPDQVDIETWATWWTEAWDAAWSVLENMPAELPGPAAAELRRRTGWIRQFGADGLDTLALERWAQHLVPPMRRPLRTHPDWRSREALQRAWEAGLRSVVVLPYRDHYVRRLSAHQLVVSAPVRNAPETYAEALALMR